MTALVLLRIADDTVSITGTGLLVAFLLAMLAGR